MFGVVGVAMIGVCNSMAYDLMMFMLFHFVHGAIFLFC